MFHLNNTSNQIANSNPRCEIRPHDTGPRFVTWFKEFSGISPKSFLFTVCCSDTSSYNTEPAQRWRPCTTALYFYHNIINSPALCSFLLLSSFHARWNLLCNCVTYGVGTDFWAGSHNIILVNCDLSSFRIAQQLMITTGSLWHNVGSPRFWNVTDFPKFGPNNVFTIELNERLRLWLLSWKFGGEEIGYRKIYRTLRFSLTGPPLSLNVQPCASVKEFESWRLSGQDRTRDFES